MSSVFCKVAGHSDLYAPLPIHLVGGSMDMKEAMYVAREIFRELKSGKAQGNKEGIEYKAEVGETVKVEMKFPEIQGLMDAENYFHNLALILRAQFPAKRGVELSVTYQGREMTYHS